MPDNLLNAFPPDDPLVNVARAALAVVLCFCFPLLLMPCRDSCIRLLDMLSASSSSAPAPPAPAPAAAALAAASSARTPLLAAHEQTAEEGQGQGRPPSSPTSAEAYGAMDRSSGNKGGAAAAEEEQPLPSITASSLASMSISGGNSSSNNSSSSSSLPRLPRAHPLSARDSGPPLAASSCLQRLLPTYLLVLIITTLAVLVDSVALIWAVIGSFGCISVGFIFPPLAYLKVGCRQQRLKRLWAWLIVCVGAVLLVLCVAQTVFALAT